MSKFSDLTKRKTSEAPKGEEEREAPAPGRPVEPESLSQRLKRGEAKQLKAIVSAGLHKRVKLASVQLERDISDITSEALERWLEGQIER